MNDEVDVTLIHEAGAQVLIEQIRKLGDAIPDLTYPTRTGETQALSTGGSIPDEAIESTAVARENNPEMVIQGGRTPDDLRGLMHYARAYDTVAAELEGLARFVRHSTAVARHLAGTEALTSYAVARRLAKLKQFAHLSFYVETMRHHLGRRFKAPYSKKAREKK